MVGFVGHAASGGLAMPLPRPLAHSKNDQGQTHDLEQHLRETAEMAARFTEWFDSGTLGEDTTHCRRLP